MKRPVSQSRTVTSLFCLIALAGLGPILAQGGKALTADDILERHIQALGGAEAMKAIETVVMKGTYDLNGEERALTIVRQRPNRVRIEIDIEGESYIEAFDGTTAWWQSPQRTDGAEPMEEMRAALFEEEWADFDGTLLAAAGRGGSLTLDGQESIDGEACWKIELALPSERTQTWYIAADSFLVKRKITPQFHPRRGEVERVWFYEDYSAAGGVQFSRYIEREDRQFVRAYQIESIDTNTEVPPGSFAMPKTAASESDP